MSEPVAAESKSPPTAARHRLQIPADMAFYAALAGKTPQIDPALADPLVAATEARREHPWSPMLLSIYLRQVCKQQATKINKPELTAWVRRQSQIARRRLQQTQTRMFEVRKDRAA